MWQVALLGALRKKMSISDSELYDIIQSGISLSTFNTEKLTFADNTSEQELPWIWMCDIANPPETEITSAKIPLSLVREAPDVLRIVGKLRSIREVSIVSDNLVAISQREHGLFAEVLKELPALTHFSSNNLLNPFDVVGSLADIALQLKSIHIQSSSIAWGSCGFCSGFRPRSVMLSGLASLPNRFPFDVSLVERLNLDSMMINDSMVQIIEKSILSDIRFFGCRLDFDVIWMLRSRFPSIRIQIDGTLQAP